MPSQSSWLHYVGLTTKGMRNMDIARTMDVARTTVDRWNKHAPELPSIKKFADAFDRPLVEALLAAGVLTPADLEPYPGWNIEALTDEELLNELLRRARLTQGNRVRRGIDPSDSE